MISKLIKLPIFKRLIPSILVRFLKTFKKNRGFFKVKDIEMYLDFLDPIDRQIILNQSYEVEELNIFEDLIKKNSSNYLLDIGANCGYYTFFILKNNPKLKVLAYEPNNEAHFKFLETLKKNEMLKESITLFNYGLSNTNSEMKLYSKVKFGYAQTGGASVETDRNGKSQIAKFKLGDDVLNFKNENLAIKIDVEKHELKTLQGMHNLIRQNNIILQIEICEKNLQTVTHYLNNAGFKLIADVKKRSNYYFTNNNISQN